ncbi:MAG: PAS domain-containing protein [Alphaproteobacteria bacterium]|jgi:hypothetical protein
MISNWHTTHIQPDSLSRRLKTAYALWLWESVNSPGELPSLKQIQSASLYQNLAPYVAIAEGRSDANIRAYVFSAAGAKVVELFGAELASRRFDEVFTESSQIMAEEARGDQDNERKPIHYAVRDSPNISKDIEVITMPLQHDDAAMNMTWLVYDF